MKKLMLVIGLLMYFISASNAQETNKAIGVRFAYGGEISYQHPLGNEHRLEVDLGWNYLGTNLAGNYSWGYALNGIYQWVWNIPDLADGFNWYAGPGAAIVSHSGFLGVGALGQIGIEYNFKFPLQLSIDYRPGFYLIPGTDNIFRTSFNGACLGARYRF